MDISKTIETAINTICSKFSPLSVESKNAYCKCVSIQSFEKNEVIVKEGQYSDKLFFIISGSVRVYYLKNGKEITDWFGFEDNFIFSINSFENKPSQYFLSTVEPTILLSIARPQLNILCNQFHDVETLGKKVITEVMLQLQKKNCITPV